MGDPFEHIENYELNKKYKVKVVKIMDFGAFCELEPGLSTLLHSSELSWTKKNPSAKKLFKVGDEIECVITEIDKEKRRVAISQKLDNLELDGFLHANDISYYGKPEEELKKYKKGE